MIQRTSLRRASLWMIAAVAVAAVSMTGCNRSEPTADQTAAVAPKAVPRGRPAGETERPAVPTQVTFYLAGMNQRLKILWGDWPNTVKQALAELDAVESVEDEWERELEGEEDLDLLFVTYDAQRITVDELKEKIQGFGFEAILPADEKTASAEENTVTAAEEPATLDEKTVPDAEKAAPADDRE